MAFENGSSFSLSTESRLFFLYAIAVYLQKIIKKYLHIFIYILVVGRYRR